MGNTKAIWRKISHLFLGDSLEFDTFFDIYLKISLILLFFWHFSEEKLDSIMSLNLPFQNLLKNTQHMCSLCVLGRSRQISSAVLIRPIRAICPWNLAWIWQMSLIWTNHNKSLSFSCFISWETAYFGIFVKKIALFLEMTSARRRTNSRATKCVWLVFQV